MESTNCLTHVEYSKRYMNDGHAIGHSNDVTQDSRNNVATTFADVSRPAALVAPTGGMRKVIPDVTHSDVHTTSAFRGHSRSNSSSTEGCDSSSLDLEAKSPDSVITPEVLGSDDAGHTPGACFWLMFSLT